MPFSTSDKATIAYSESTGISRREAVVAAFAMSAVPALSGVAGSTVEVHSVAGIIPNGDQGVGLDVQSEYPNHAHSRWQPHHMMKTLLRKPGSS